VVLVGLGIALSACGGGEGFLHRPAAEQVADPRAVSSFELLYATNCAGCHGARGEGGPARGLAAPGYLVSVSDAAIHSVIAEGRPKTAMPAFAQSAGGMLSDAQVSALVAGIRAWAPAGLTADPRMPHYPAATAGDAQRGARVFRERCGSCHGADGRGAQRVGSIVDDSFLDLISAPALARTIIAGRPDLGCPDWRGNGPAPLTTEDVADAVAWLLAQRQQFPGQPYPSALADRRK
jgi:mono/diheme cytochrome c family protein